MPVAKDSAVAAKDAATDVKDAAADRAARYDDKMTATEKREAEKEAEKTAKEAEKTAKEAEKDLPKYDEMDAGDKQKINAEGLTDELRDKADELGLAYVGADGVDIPRVDLEENIARTEAGMAPKDRSAGSADATGSKDGVDPDWDTPEIEEQKARAKKA